MTRSGDARLDDHSFGPLEAGAPNREALGRALVEQFQRNWDSGDDAANSDLVAAACASIRRARAADRPGRVS